MRHCEPRPHDPAFDRLTAIAFVACINPADLRPGLWLSGEVAQPVDDWSFVNDHGEIFVEVVGILRPAPLDHGRVGIAAPSE